MERYRGGAVPERRTGVDRFFDYAWDRFFRPFWDLTPFGPGETRPYGVIEPAIDMFETDDHMVVKAEVPGLDPGHIKVTVTEDSVAFRGETREEREESQGGYHWHERRHGLVQRMVPLARRVDPESARASFRNGVLTIRAQKLGSERARTVEINVENEQTGFDGKPPERH